jgi:hypothetical protein
MIVGYTIPRMFSRILGVSVLHTLTPKIRESAINCQEYNLSIIPASQRINRFFGSCRGDLPDLGV